MGGLDFSASVRLAEAGGPWLIDLSEGHLIGSPKWVFVKV